jgi:uncharacterized protein YciI
VHYLLLYDYVDNAVERRAPYREEHIRLATEAHRRGELVMAGAFADPVDGAAFVFQGEDATAAEGFVASDPYVAHGIVTGWRVRPWTVVVHE